MGNQRVLNTWVQVDTVLLVTALSAALLNV